MLLPTLSKDLHLQTSVSLFTLETAKLLPTAMARQHLGARVSTLKSYGTTPTHLRFARSPILLFVVAVRQLRILVWSVSVEA